MTLTIPTRDLPDGVRIPVLGFGTYKIEPTRTRRCVEAALSVGLRHIDTAQMYGNESGVGQALASSGIDRAELFITTKLNNGNHAPKRARDSFARSLDDLGLDYVDLFLIHWPLPTRYGGDFVSTWETLLELCDDGLARAVGVSNFQIPHLERIIAATGRPPAVNQIEAHPYFANNVVRQWCRDHEIVTEAWSPLGRGVVLTDPAVIAIADRLGRTPAQVVLRWAIERGDIVFPKSTSPERIRENTRVFDFELDTQARTRLDELDQGENGRQGSHPDTMDIIDR
ncbi:MAG: aldo/keto reductase [Actinomycetaceae bacterium]|nr:aldo/keto reductase [Actinomycetaceae bacterium]